MAKRRKLKDIVVQRAVVEFVRNSITDGVPSEASLRSSLLGACVEYEGDDVDGDSTPLDGAIVVDIKTTVRKVPVEEPQA